MKRIEKFPEKVRLQRLAAQIEGETHKKIIPHLRGEAPHGYFFKTAEELAAANAKELDTTVITLKLVERAARKMGEAEGHAFRHIVHREIRGRLWDYLKVTTERMLHTTQGSHFDR